MVFSDIILLLITVYLSFVYGLLYLFCEAYPIAFSKVHGWQPGVALLPLLSVAVGILISAILLASWHTHTRDRADSGHLAKEHLPPMILGGFVLSIGLFWFASTSDYKIS
jgi:hypothetical protein